MTPISRTILIAVFLAAAFPSTGHTHGLGAEAKLKDGKVHVEGYFDDDTPAADARVWVEDGMKQKVAEGKMDAGGRWSFAAPAPGRYRVIVDAGGGHRAAVTVTIPAPQVEKTSSEPEPVQVSEGKSREEFTQFPWVRLGLGIALIGALAFALPRLLRTVRRKADSAVSPEKPA